MYYSIYQLIRFLTIGIFQKAIMQSGCIFNTWALNEKHRETANRFAKNMGCEKDDPREIIQYLKNVPAKDLVKKTKFEVRLLNC